jgi:hypothetical protein
LFKRISTIGIIGFIIILIAALAGMVWSNLQFSYWEFGGSDFYVNWFGTRTLIVDGTSPYSDVVMSETQEFITGKTMVINAEGSVISTPLYAIVLTLPFAMIEDFVVARTLWIFSQQLALIVLTLVLLKITKWQPKLWEFSLLFVGVFLSHFAIIAYLSGNMIILTSLLLVLSLGAIKVERDEIAGGLLALTTFQPQVFVFTILFILLWSITNKRRLVLIWFFGSVFILISIGLLLVPAWPLQYLQILVKFLEYFPYLSPGGVITERWPGIGVQLSVIITLLTVLILIIEWWLARAKEYRWFLWTTCLTLVLTRLIGIPVHPIHNFVLIIPLLLVFSIVQERWNKAGGWLIVIFIIIFLGGWIQLLDNIFYQPEPYPVNLLYPFPVLLLSCCIGCVGGQFVPSGFIFRRCYLVIKIKPFSLKTRTLWCLTVIVGIFIFINTHPIRPHDFWWHITVGKEILRLTQSRVLINTPLRCMVNLILPTKCFG